MVQTVPMWLVIPNHSVPHVKKKELRKWTRFAFMLVFFLMHFRFVSDFNERSTRLWGRIVYMIVCSRGVWCLPNLLETYGSFLICFVSPLFCSWLFPPLLVTNLLTCWALSLAWPKIMFVFSLEALQWFLDRRAAFAASGWQVIIAHFLLRSMRLCSSSHPSKSRNFYIEDWCFLFYCLRSVEKGLQRLNMQKF